MRTDFQTFIEILRDHNPIRDVLSEHITINHSNMAKCPFHDDKTPSLSISESKELWHCFGCGLGGDVFRFLESINNCSFREAVDTLSDRAGIPRFKYSPEMLEKLEESKRIQEIRWSGITFYHSNLANHSVARDYLRKRGIPERLINSEKLGVASGGLTEYLIDEKNFDADDCVKSGLIRRIKQGVLKDWFDNQHGDRIILPNIRRGRVIHITGRTLGKESGSNPKYWHIPGNLELWGVDSARGKKSVVVVEGIFDALSLLAIDIHAIALVGVHLKENHIDRF
jgi:DNA primase